MKIYKSHFCTDMSDFDKILQMKLKMCNSVADFNNSCNSCVSYSIISETCRLSGEMFSKRCNEHSHIGKNKRQADFIDRLELAELLKVEKKKEVKQLELF